MPDPFGPVTSRKPGARNAERDPSQRPLAAVPLLEAFPDDHRALPPPPPDGRKVAVMWLDRRREDDEDEEDDADHAVDGEEGRIEPAEIAGTDERVLVDEEACDRHDAEPVEDVAAETDADGREQQDGGDVEERALP